METVFELLHWESMRHGASSSSQEAQRNQGLSVAAEYTLERKGPTSKHLLQPLRGSTQTVPEVASVVI